MELPNIKFSFETLNEIIKKCPVSVDKNDKATVDYTQAYEYIAKYFYINDDGNYLFWNVKDFKVYDQAKLKDVYFNRMNKAINNWFFREYINICNLNCDTQKPRIYKDESGTLTINGFKGFMHKAKKYDTYDNKTKDAVNLYLKHIHDVLSNKRQDVFEYLLKWLSNVAKGNKNDSCLYLKSIEGTGKSTLSEFMIHHVFGKDVSIKSNSDPLRKDYNKMLFGNILVVFEELPTFSASEWDAVSSKLKDYITGNDTIYNEKYEKSFRAQNFNNYIINTNVEALKHSEGRRYFTLDVSTEKVGDSKYFDTLYDTCFNDKVGEAFYSYLLDVDTKNWKGQKCMPETTSKLNALCERLDLVYKFLKEYYIRPKYNLKDKLSNIYSLYVAFCTNLDKKAQTKQYFVSKLKEINIEYRKTNGYNILDVSYETLREIAEKRHWIHELDEIDAEGDLSDDDDLKIEDTEKTQMKQEIIILKKENDDLKKQNDEILKQLMEMKTMMQTLQANAEEKDEKHIKPKKEKTVKKVKTDKVVKETAKHVVSQLFVEL